MILENLYFLNFLDDFWVLGTNSWQIIALIAFSERLGDYTTSSLWRNYLIWYFKLNANLFTKIYFSHIFYILELYDFYLNILHEMKGCIKCVPFCDD